MSKERIGFIGVGLMGHGMAKNLVTKGFPLTIMGNRNRAPVDNLVSLGAKEVKTARDVAASSDIVFLCVTDSPTVEALVSGPQGLKAGAHRGLVIVDCSTADPTSTRRIIDDLAPFGVTFCDAPLGGTPVQAEEGKLFAMVGCDEATFTRIRPAIEAWAGRVQHFGPATTGHKLKLINNFIAQGYGAIYAEAFALARKSGIAPETLFNVINGGRMDCGYFQTFAAYAARGELESHKFSIRNALKDLRYVETMANAAVVSNPVGNAVKNTYALATAQGEGDTFVPLVVDVIATQNGLPPYHAKKR
ncbi:MAG TPA: NAD(P)-dependent oxidoreductase [Beijerinckiaceae bacterium]|nr:NAD(P)-dependent oxidoreductase [Beijerinckiaceae bacterium]